MRVRFQADADFNNSAVLAIARKWPFLDIRSAQGLVADGVPDSEILALAAAQGRVLLTHDQQWAKLSRIVEIADEIWGCA